jgi:hypothetical protein
MYPEVVREHIFREVQISNQQTIRSKRSMLYPIEEIIQIIIEEDVKIVFITWEIKNIC